MGMVRWRRAVVALTAVGVLGAGLAGTAGVARAVDPDKLREGCEWRTDEEEANHVQTCTFYSQSLGRDVTVQIRASDNAAGETEQGIYFLDGLGSDPEYSTWSTDDAGALAAYSSSYNLVMPAGGAGEWMTNWQEAPTGETSAPEWDTFLGEELPAYLATNFDVGTSNNAIVGVSMSGASAVIVGLNHPEVFSVIRSYSGYYQTDSVLAWVMIPLIQVARANISNGLWAMWGLPLSEGNGWAINDVVARIAEAKANGQTVIISTGNGVMTERELSAAWAVIEEQFALDPGYALSLVPAAIQGVLLGTALEAGALVSTVVLNAVTTALDIPVEFKYANGSHNWFAWAANEDADAAEIEDALAGSASASAVAGSGAKVAAVSEVTTSEVTTSEVSTPEVTSTPAVTTSEVSAPEVTSTPEVPTSEVSIPEVTSTPEVPTSEVSIPEVTSTSEVPTSEASTPEVTSTPEVPTSEVSTPEVTSAPEPGASSTL